MSDQGKCLAPGCKRKAVRRGNCATCYQGLYRLVKAGKTTWKKLEKAGRVLKRGKPGPATTNPAVLAALKDK